jgi:hypothetical protein
VRSVVKLLGIAVILSCGESPTRSSGPAVPVVTVVRLTLPDSALWVGQVVQPSVTVLDQRGTAMSVQDLVWSSSQPIVVRVDPDGRITAVAPGQATISVSVASVSASVGVTASLVPPARIEIVPPESPLFDGQAGRFSAIVRDSAGGELSRSVSWTTSDAARATISSDGMLSAVVSGNVGVIARIGGIASELVYSIGDGVGFQSDLASVMAYHPLRLTWAALYGSTCLASGEWKGPRPNNGIEMVSPLITGEARYELRCTGPDQVVRHRSITVQATPANVFPETCVGSTGDVVRDNRFLGEYLVFNGKWGVEQDPNLSPNHREQCVSGRLLDGGIETNWRWHFDPAIGGVVSYPNATAGYLMAESHPVERWWWSTSPALPASADAARGMRLEYREIIAPDADPQFNTMVELNFWKNSIPKADEFVLEISINVVSNFRLPVQETVTIDGMQYDVHKGIASSQLIFDARTAAVEGTVSFRGFIDYALEKGYLRTSDYLGQVQIGNEIWGGRGGALLWYKFVP